MWPHVLIGLTDQNEALEVGLGLGANQRGDEGIGRLIGGEQYTVDRLRIEQHSCQTIRVRAIALAQKDRLTVQGPLGRSVDQSPFTRAP